MASIACHYIARSTHYLHAHTGQHQRLTHTPIRTRSRANFPQPPPQSGIRFPFERWFGKWGPRTKSRTQFGSRRESDVYERGARGDSLGVPPERPVRPRRLQEPAAFPEQGQPVCLAQAGGGGRADRPRDARPGGAHALLARRGQPRVRREARGRRARLPAEASSRRGRGQDEGNRARRGRRRAAHASRFRPKTGTRGQELCKDSGRWPCDRSCNGAVRIIREV